MDVGFLAKAWLLKDQLHIKPCQRCGLHYDQRTPACPHCGDLDDAALKVMLEEKDRERQGNAAMGRVFLVIASVLGAFVLIGLLSL
jgi:hypothetical protein